MRGRALELITGLLVVQLLLPLPDQVNAMKNRLRKQRSKPQEHQQSSNDYEYDYNYENYDEYDEKNGECLMNVRKNFTHAMNKKKRITFNLTIYSFY